MPFISNDRRAAAFKEGPFRLTELQPGDLCYLEYFQLMVVWKHNPRWTTADQLFGYVLGRSIWLLCTFQWRRLKALLLAWQVFFIKRVMPYEDKKEAENGPI